jgi:ParB family transcriptional regulator, chromosome partitioning protein
MDTTRLDLDLHRLELRFANARLGEPRAVEQLVRSIERDGQIVPCIAVPGAAATGLAGGEPHILIDGYRRVAALRRLGRDTASVECWACDIGQALLAVLARSRSRPFAALEEALLLRELTQGLGLSQLEVARRCGRDDSWVNRRLQLLSALPDAALAAVRDGRLSTWSASRVIAPLARASGEHADRLLTALLRAPISTRELRNWFEHYQKARRAVRERMVNQPHLFVQALKESSEQEISDRLRDGPEGECELDLRRINGLIRRVRRRLPLLCPLSEALVTAVSRAQTNFEALWDDIKRYGEHDPDRDPQQRQNPESARSEPARDQPSAQTVA